MFRSYFIPWHRYLFRSQSPSIGLHPRTSPSHLLASVTLHWTPFWLRLVTSFKACLLTFYLKLLHSFCQLLPTRTLHISEPLQNYQIYYHFFFLAPNCASLFSHSFLLPRYFVFITLSLCLIYPHYSAPYVIVGIVSFSYRFLHTLIYTSDIEHHLLCTKGF